MSFIHRPGAVINGVRRTRTNRFFWCRQCDQTVRITSSSSDPFRFICPLCYNLLFQEFHLSRPQFTIQDRESTSSAAHMLDIMAQYIEPPCPISPPEYALSWSGNNPQQDPISEFEEFMPVVRITDDILQKDSTCPICKEEFILDEQIRKMPCCHYYHSGCLLPWIRIHNTCPVCRYRIPLETHTSDNDVNSSNFQTANYDANQEGIDDFRFEEVVNLAWPSWDELVSLWPFNFGSFLNWSFHDQDESLIDTASTRTGFLLNEFDV